MDGEEIDRLFLEEEQITESDSLKMIEKYINDSKPLLTSLENLEKEMDSHLKIFEFYKLKLESLSKEMEGIECKNDDTKKELENKKKLYDALKKLLVTIEIKKEHFNALNNPDFNNLGSMQIALCVLKDFECDYNLKIVNDRKETINQTLKAFMKKFIRFLERKLNTFETESTGELKIHTKIYEEIKRYEFVFDFCKDMNKEHFILITKKYLSFGKSLYEHEFEKHLNYILKAIKEYKNKLKTKLEELFLMIFESFSAILRCENGFIRRIFFDKSEFANDFVKNMFSDVLNIILDFLRDCNKINKILTINALFKIKELRMDFGEQNIDFINTIRDKIETFLIDSENEYIKSLESKWKIDGKRKILAIAIEGIKNNSNENMNIKILDFLIQEVQKIERGSKGKLEFVIYRLKMIYDLRMIKLSVINRKTTVFYETLEKEFEKEAITYVLTEESSKITKSISNIDKLIITASQNNLEFHGYLYSKLKSVLYENISLEQKVFVDKFFNS